MGATRTRPAPGHQATPAEVRAAIGAALDANPAIRDRLVDGGVATVFQPNAVVTPARVPSVASIVHREGARAHLTLDSGRYPAGRAEAMVSSRCAEVFGLRLGDRVRCGRSCRARRPNRSRSR